MATVETVIGPVTGAIISGLVGVAIVEYRNWREGVGELKSWYDGAVRLAERIERAHIDEQYGGHHGQYVRATCAGVHTKLANHVSEAPAGIEDEVLAAAEELISDCQRVKAIERTRAGSKPAEVMNQMESALESADELIASSKNAKHKI